MNIFHKVTLQILKQNKTRTIVTMIGIVLSAAMICAVTTFASSIRSYALRAALYTDGDWHGSASGVQWEQYEDILSSDQTAYATYGQLLGYANIGSENEFKPYLYIVGGEKDRFVQTLPVHLTAGTYPADPTQILLPAHLSSNGGVSCSIGDTLTLQLGDRLLDGWAMFQNNPCYIYENGEEVFNGETLKVRETRSYTVVGFYERFNYQLEEYSAPGYTAITVADEHPADSCLYDVYFRMETPSEIYSYMKEQGITGSRNTDVLMFLGTSQYSGFDVMLTGLAAIVIVLIMFGSVSLIYNAFSISVSERTRQFGLLSSVGATKKQLRAMVLFEALAVSSIGIPAGIASGIVGIGITLFFVGHKFTAFGYPIKMELSISAGSVAAAAVTALITVLISAWIPATRASRVCAIEAIRQSRDISVSRRQTKTSGLVYRLFGLPGVLAAKHFKRSRKKYRATVASLFMSIVLFVSASAFTDYLTESVSGGFSTNGYDIAFFCREDNWGDLTPEELLSRVLASDRVTGGAFSQSLGFQARIDNADLTEAYLETLAPGASVDGLVAAPSEQETDLHILLYFISDDYYKELLRQYGLEEDVYMDPARPLAIAVDGDVSFNYETERYEQTDILSAKAPLITAYDQRTFDGYSLDGIQTDAAGTRFFRYVSDADPDIIMDIPETQAYYQIPLQAGTVIYDMPAFIGGYNSLELIYPQSLKKAVLPEETFDNISYAYNVTSDDHSASYTALTELLDSNGFSSKNITDYAAQVEQERNIVTIIHVFSYGFIVLISLIAAANVFNTISTNIALRRREFAMLRSVGMANKDFYRMLSFECLLYGAKALLYGLPVSVLMTRWIYTEVSSGYASSFRLPWLGICVAAGSVFIVVFVTMLYAMGKLRNDNPIDALKNENL